MNLSIWMIIFFPLLLLTMVTIEKWYGPKSRRKISYESQRLLLTLFIVLGPNALTWYMTGRGLKEIAIATAVLVMAALIGNFIGPKVYQVVDFSEVSIKNVILKACRELDLGEVTITSEQEELKEVIRFSKSKATLSLVYANRFPTDLAIVKLGFHTIHKGPIIKPIIETIREAVEPYEIPRDSMGIRWFKGVTVTVMLAGILVMGTNILIETYEQQLMPISTYPEQLTVTKLDKNITDQKQHEVNVLTDEAAIKAFYEAHLNGQIFDQYEINLEHKMMSFDYEVVFDAPWKRAYIGDYESFLVVDYEIMAAEESWVRPFAILYRLWHKEDQKIYRFL